jgi:hypothetical protein
MAILQSSTMVMGVLLVPMMLTVLVGHHISLSASPVRFGDLPWWPLLWLIPMGVLGVGIALSGSLLVLVVLPLGAVFEVIRPRRAAQRATCQRERAALPRVIQSTPPKGAPGR